MAGSCQPNAMSVPCRAVDAALLATVSGAGRVSVSTVRGAGRVSVSTVSGGRASVSFNGQWTMRVSVSRLRNVRFSRGISRRISRGISRESCAPEHSYSHAARTSTCIPLAHSHTGMQRIATFKFWWRTLRSSHFGVSPGLSSAYSSSFNLPGLALPQ